jgi:uncharacterized membrane protein
MITILSSFQFIATLCCGLFAGAAIYINLVEHPARLECGTELAATVFEPSYRRAYVMQATLALLGFICAVVAWLLGAGISWLVGGLFLGTVIPFTFIKMMPVNKQLIASSHGKNDLQSRELLIHWGKLHAVRSSLSFVALIILLSNF